MDFGKLFESIEDAVYEVMVWILLLPKTFFRVMFQPKWAMQYALDEWKKEPDERFDEYLSPVMLWLLVAVIPLSLITVLMEGAELNTLNDVAQKVADNLFPMTFYAMIVPFTYILWMEMINKQPIKKSTLKRSLYLHCYALAPSQILTAIFFPVVFAIPPLGFVVALIIPFYEAFVFVTELGITYFRALLYVILPQAVLIPFLLLVIGAFSSV